MSTLGEFWSYFIEPAQDSEQIWAIADGESLTYRELARGVVAVTNELELRGVSPESSVALRAEPGLYYLQVLFGLWSRGNTVLLIDPRIPAEEFARRIGDIGPEFVVQLEGRGLNVVIESEAPVPSEQQTLRSPDSVFPHNALIQWSSGSTGTPKITSRSMASIISEVDRHLSVAGLPTFGDRVMVLNSLMHTMGLVSGVLHSLKVQATLVLAKSSLPRHVFDGATTAEVTALYGVPSQFDLLCAAPDYPQLPSLRLAVTGGEILSVSTWRTFKDRWQTEISQVYGLTETGLLVAGVNTGYPPPVVGTAVPGVETRLRNGELEVRLNNDPYISGPALQKDGWFRSRDRFAIGDTHGYLEIRGRTDSLVAIGGLKVDLTEIQNVLKNHPQVRDAVVTYEDVIEAYVELADIGTGPDEIREWCARYLPPVSVPKRVEVLASLPRNATGKLLQSRDEIRQYIADTHATGTALVNKRAIRELLSSESIGVLQEGISDDAILAIDSFVMLKIQIELERICGVVIDPEPRDVRNFDTVNGIVSFVNKAMLAGHDSKGPQTAHSQLQPAKGDESDESI